MIRTIPFSGDPFTIFRKFYGRPGLFFLDSSQPGAQARYSYIGFSPFKTVTGGSFDVLRRAFQKYHKPRRGEMLCGGAVGYVGYEGGFHFGFYDQVIAFDRQRKDLIINAPNKSQVEDIRAVLADQAPRIPRVSPVKRRIEFKSNFNKAGYISAVRKALWHIQRGDIYQINLSRILQLSLDWEKHADAAAMYSALRQHSPSPFAAYFDDSRQIILSSSPERFLKFSGGIAQVKPMKGTRPRGRSAAQDRRLRHELLHSPKEIAELLMVTDLERNDLGRVCEYGSVKVKARRSIEAYKNVFQATATIEGKLHRGKDQFDLLQAVFPSGSVTGCPKIEAMKIIAQLEKAPRGLYTGALGYIDFGGHMDFSVLIRSIFLKPGKITFHAGGGIVADSDPQAEYDETGVKAAAMQAALNEVLHG